MEPIGTAGRLVVVERHTEIIVAEEPAEGSLHLLQVGLVAAAAKGLLVGQHKGGRFERLLIILCGLTAFRIPALVAHRAQVAGGETDPFQKGQRFHADRQE